MPKIGFIGLGIMGKPMARNLIDAGYKLRVYNRSEESINKLVEYGAERGSSPRDIAENCEVIITMLPDSGDVKKVVLGENGVLEGISAGKILIDMSSIAPLVAREIANELGKKGAEMLDAPVSGGEEKAESGDLAIMVGGKEEVFKKVEDILQVMGGSVSLLGDNGAGQVTKLVNQVMVAINIAAAAEGLVLGKKAGVNPEKIFQAIKGGLAGSQCLDDKAPRMFAGDYAPGGKLRFHVKDLKNVFETSRELHIGMPLTAQVMEMMQALISKGYADIDHGGLALFFEELNGITLEDR